MWFWKANLNKQDNFRRGREKEEEPASNQLDRKHPRKKC